MNFEDYQRTERTNSGTYYGNDEQGKQTRRDGREELKTDLLERFAYELDTPLQSRGSWQERYHAQLDAKLAKMFDGDKPIEINNDKCPKKNEQQWLVVMNLATDFGGECTIEKRTKKLQELAAQTGDKAVTIVVQTSVKDEASGKYNLERFVLKDGKVNKLKSPGESQGYGSDLEGLLKYASKTYPSKNLGLILDSHGNGNEGLSGDSSDLSMADFKKHVQSALKGSGHEKLDFLQFDACLMAQNGVLESTQSLAKHVVASAEPEGVTADTASADNKNLAQLLKDPSMTPDQFAEFCVKQAKDVEGFDTLAHFDMAKYASFRESLDAFGEGLAKLWEDKEQREVLRKIIRETFEYGNGGFHIKEKPGDKPLPERIPELFERPFPPLSMSDLIGLPPFSRSLGTGKRDLKDFAEKVIAAAESGKLKDPDSKLRDAAKKLLKEGESVTKSFFGRGERKGLGGLSVYLPADGAHDDIATISSTGGWRQFQELLKKAEKKK